MNLLLVFFGAGVGGLLRYGVGLMSVRLFGASFPWGTLAINVVGSALMGLVIGLLAFRIDAYWHQSVRLLLTTGLLVGFTTFSAFSLEAVLLWEQEAWIAAILYVLGSVVLSLSALAAVLGLVRSMG